MQFENIYSQYQNQHRQNLSDDRQKGKTQDKHDQGGSNQHQPNGKF
jgi:hypothetical protein